MRLLFLVTIIAALFRTSAAECSPEPEDAAWLDKTIKAWHAVRNDQLKLKPANLPWIVLFDEKCVLNINPNLRQFVISNGQTPRTITLAGEKATVYSARHDGNILLPDSQKIPAQIVSFAAAYEGGKRSFFVAALPSIWAKAEHLKGEKDLATLVRGVYIHELTHTYHRNFFARLSVLEKQLTDVEDFDDDVIQNIFSKDEIFRKAYVDEIALANAAVNEPGLEMKRKTAKRLLDAMKQRRKQFYSGENKKFEEVEDIFLTMEGVANWAGYRAAVGDGLSPQDASRLIRRGGRKWSQEAGILLFMIIDPLMPNWQRTAFGDERVSIIDLLERAVR